MEVFNLADKLIEERQKNKELQEIIDKTTEYINNNSIIYVDEMQFSTSAKPEELLNILKGE